MSHVEGDKEPLEADEAEAAAQAVSAPRERLASGPPSQASARRPSAPPRPDGPRPGTLRRPSEPPRPRTREDATEEPGAALIPIHAMRVIAVGRDDDESEPRPEIGDDDIEESDESASGLAAALHRAASEAPPAGAGSAASQPPRPPSVPAPAEVAVAARGSEVGASEAPSAGAPGAGAVTNDVSVVDESMFEEPEESGPEVGDSPTTGVSSLDVGAEAMAPGDEVELEEDEGDVEALDDADLAVEPALPPPPKALSKSAPPRPKARSQVPQPPTSRRRPWWEHLFGDDFARAYRPLTEAQVRVQVDFIEKSLALSPGAVVLDLCCGQGQQAVELAARGHGVVGYDLSVFQLALAAENAQARQQKINFLQGDAREMAFDQMFDAVLCWDTSFGYFEEEKNLNVAERIFKALRPGGVLLLDMLNRDFAAVESPNDVWFEGDGCICMDDVSLDWITSRLRVKRSLILDDGRSREAVYSLRLYSLHELGKLLHDVGFRVTQCSGSLTTPGVFLGPCSPRIIIHAQKPA